MLLSPQNLFVRLPGQPCNSVCGSLRFVRILFDILAALLVHLALMLVKIKLIHLVAFANFESLDIACFTFHKPSFVWQIISSPDSRLTLKRAHSYSQLFDKPTFVPSSRLSSVGRASDS